MIREQPLVSVIIPVYNGSRFMREAIDSALAQTYQNIEILVVNDGSTDETREIAMSYGSQIRYFEKKNGGVATALNLGLQEMKGEYFSWLSHDDWYMSQKIEEEIGALRACGDMKRAVYSECDFVKYPGGKSYRTNNLRFQRKLAEYGWFAVVMGLISGCTLLIPKSFFEKYGGFDEKVRAVNDYEQWFRMFKDKKLAFVENSLVGSRIHERQVTATYEGLDKEDDWLWTHILNELQDIDVEQAGISLYQIYSMKLSQYAFRKGLPQTKQVLINFLQRNEEPRNGREQRTRFLEKVHSISDGLYVYCAGRIARRFIASFRWRGISVDGVSDSNSSRWGRLFEGVPCIPPSKIPPNARIIVANLYPSAIINQLRSKGYAHVESYDVWDYDLLMTPINKEYCELLQ